jgi:stage II sporulation protein D
MLSRNGYAGPADSASLFNFRQPSRMQEYTTGTFKLPLNVIRNELKLRSAWFSVKAEGDSLRLSGRGYGHGIGLCQEGAMVMAAQGISYSDIISFYFPGVRIISISDAKKVNEDNTAGKD